MFSDPSEPESHPGEAPPYSRGNGAKREGLFAALRRLCFRKDRDSLRKTLEEVIEEHDASGGPIDKEERAMLKNVLHFNEHTVQDVMIPRADIVAVPFDVSFDDLKKRFLEEQHTRLPVYRETLDDILGFVHVKDLVKVMADGSRFKTEEILRQALFVPPSMKLSGLLVKMQLSRVHIAIVVDEYGGTAGLLTMEDVVEEIVGEIEDEHDVEDGTLFMQTGKNRFEASARMEISELNNKLGVEIRVPDREEDFDTLGGLLFALLGHVPAVGEVASLQLPELLLEFEILDADPRRIKRVMIQRKKNAQTRAA